jgi:hypothetical protein
MLALLFKSLLIVSIFLSSVGGTAVSSATPLPGSPAYPIKILLEEARLSMSNNLANQVALHFAFAQERAEEMAGLAAKNQAPSPQLMANYQVHWREALQLAGQMPNGEMQQLMEKAQQMAQEQQTMLAQARLGTTNQVRTRLQEAEGCLTQVQTAVNLGLQNQYTYRQQIKNVSEEWPGESFTSGPGYGPGPGNGEAPYGPGDCENPGECDGDGNSYGPGEPSGPGNEDPGHEGSGGEHGGGQGGGGNR